jgi:uncharacterized protein
LHRLVYVHPDRIECIRYLIVSVGPMSPNSSTASTKLDANLIVAEVDGGRIADNILMFGRLLRAAGLPVGPEKVLRATEAVIATGIREQATLYWALHAVFVNRRTEREIFNQAFVMFWKDPDLIDQMLSMMLPSFRANAEQEDKALSRRVSESLFKHRDRPTAQAEDQLEIDASGSFSASDVSRSKDFEQMSATELAQAKRAMRRLVLPFEEIRTRRYAASAHDARIDLRRILRETGSKGPDYMLPRYRQRVKRRPPIVVLVDISGSMDTYARIFLHFLHALTNDRDRVHSFLFGTRLSHVTRALKNRDPDVALAKISADVNDWSGGTRIGAALDDFNKHWARRVLGQNALVLLFTDGLDRDGAEGLELAARRLRANCRRLVWLNPLLRYNQYEPIAAGARALRPHVSELRKCHSLDSLEDLAKALSGRA